MHWLEIDAFDGKTISTSLVAVNALQCGQLGILPATGHRVARDDLRRRFDRAAGSSFAAAITDLAPHWTSKSARADLAYRIMLPGRRHSRGRDPDGSILR